MADCLVRPSCATWCCGNWARLLSSRQSFAKRPRGRCCCRGGVRACALRLWQQRKRSADLLGVAARYATFPILLETYRECMRDVFDIPAPRRSCARLRPAKMRVTTVDSIKPSPFASALLFSYIANYIYDGDAPLAERRAQALAIDQSQLQELLGESDLRELLDAAALDEVEAQLQALDPEHQARHADGVHDLLLRLGDLSRRRAGGPLCQPEVAGQVEELVQRGAWFAHTPGERVAFHRGRRCGALSRCLRRTSAARTAGRLAGEIGGRRCCRSCAGIARTHGPFTTAEVAARFAIEAPRVELLLRALHGEGKLLEGEFRPTGTHQEWCDPEVLRHCAP